MKKFLIHATILLLILTMLAGCRESQAEQPAGMEPPTTEPPTEASTQSPYVNPLTGESSKQEMTSRIFCVSIKAEAMPWQ